MKIKITSQISSFPFPYGHLKPEEKEFLRQFDGEEFTAERVNMNYYQLKNGMHVHIYNATEISS